MTLPTRFSPEQPTVVINTPAEYDSARREADRLANAEPGSVDALTFQAFSAAIELYEARRGRDTGCSSTDEAASRLTGSDANS
ncbi:hypothetical protein [Bosea rubneri]|uniref:Uncharacterized protein n=1 Tax=Bosea rubneri TaxID=3075434 RepID=A0ABU3SGT4_9HYPH|nr:hypothetical protein [Bosea sp. ZW T0_25]MDU0343896.1 hypothetical protein [Bosea sp. ZW T0_25]